MRTVNLGGKPVGEGAPVYIVAEIGNNFVDFAGAARLIDLAVAAGVDAVKLQTFEAETIASRSALFDMPNTGVISQYDLFKKYEVDLPLHREIWAYGREKGIFLFSTPSHMRDVELLEKLDCGAYKIGSDDAVNLPFLEEVAALGKPMVVSTGMCTLQEVREAVAVILGRGNPDLVLLHCVSQYPSEPAGVNLACVPAMAREFGLPVGYSDHTLGPLCCVAAAALGARLLEKHFTHDKGAEGPDHMLSADPAEMTALVQGVRTVEAALGDGVKRPAAQESSTRRHNRKGLVTVAAIPQGTVITGEMVAIKRPGLGILPKYLPQVVGRVARRDLAAEEPVTWDAV
ncbi:MAG: N-acetylneuraminate synthase family protein [Deltaproteobacteria bacterium]|nr:N-acetylneuraminate synthase family protein [Deltaproteobacteria bacterium]